MPPSVAPAPPERSDPRSGGPPLAEPPPRPEPRPEATQNEPQGEPAPADPAAILAPLLAALPALLAPLLQSTSSGAATPAAAANPRGGNGLAPGVTNGGGADADQGSGGYGRVAATPEAVRDFLERVRDVLFGNGATTNGVGTNGLGAPVHGNGGYGETFDGHRDAARLTANSETAIDNLKPQLRKAIERYVGNHEANRNLIDDLIREFEKELRVANGFPSAKRESQIRRIVQDTLQRAEQIIGAEQNNSQQTGMDINNLTKQITDQYLGDLNSGVPSSPATNFGLAQLVAPRYGWGPRELNDWYRLGVKESGWDNTAQNPNSTAYGIGQFLDKTWATVGGYKTSDPRTQVEYMARYIRQRYGSPSSALAFHDANNWY